MKEPKPKLVFISTPYTGSVEVNVAFAQKACFYAICQGHTPIAPHLIYPGIVPDEDPAWREVGIDMGCDWLALCDEVWLCGPSVTAGMQAELDLANDLGIAVRYLSSEEILRGAGDLATQALGIQQNLRGFA